MVLVFARSGAQGGMRMALSDKQLVEQCEQAASAHRFGVLVVSALLQAVKDKRPSRRKWALGILRAAAAGAEHERLRAELARIL